MNSSALNLFYCLGLTSVHDYWKNHSFDCIWTFVGKVTSLLFNTLPRFVIAFAFVSRSKCLLISRVLSTVILEPKKIKSVGEATVKSLMIEAPHWHYSISAESGTALPPPVQRAVLRW